MMAGKPCANWPRDVEPEADRPVYPVPQVVHAVSVLALQVGRRPNELLEQQQGRRAAEGRSHAGKHRSAPYVLVAEVGPDAECIGDVDHRTQCPRC